MATLPGQAGKYPAGGQLRLARTVLTRLVPGTVLAGFATAAILARFVPGNGTEWRTLLDDGTEPSAEPGPETGKPEIIGLSRTTHKCARQSAAEGGFLYGSHFVLQRVNHAAGDQPCRMVGYSALKF